MGVILLGTLLLLGAQVKACAETHCDTYVASNITGGFTTKVFIDFSSAKPGDNTAAVLKANGLSISDYVVKDGFMPHAFVPKNVALGNGSLDFEVTAYPQSGGGAQPIQSSEVITNDQFLYGSVRTVLKSSGVPGVCEGNFMYHNDNAEIDWEILTSTTKKPSADIPAGIWATNQALVPGQHDTHAVVPFAFNPSADYHEYRIDWTAEATTFYIDGVQQAHLTSNVPKIAGNWIWNSWSNGDPEWSAGPPTANSFTHIRSIEIYKGYKSTASGNICHI